MKNIVILSILPFVLTTNSIAQNVGIGTTQPNPSALLHIHLGSNIDRGFLITGQFDFNGVATVPNLGSGSRLMFFPGKAAFRAGYVIGAYWNDSLIGPGSGAIGYNTVASGRYSASFGSNNIASGEGAIAMGYQTIASGDYSIAVGRQNHANGIAAVAMGGSTKAFGNGAIAMGQGTSANGGASIALGYYTTAISNFSMAVGYKTVAKAGGSFVIGENNDTSDAPILNSSSMNDRIFQVGNGLSENSRSNAVTVLRNGNTGIGVVDPSYRLDLDSRIRIRSGGSGSSSAGIWLNKNDNSGLLGFVGVDANNDIGIYNNSSSGWSFLIDNATGNAWLKGTLTQNSDARLKKNIEPINNALSQLSQLNGYHYNWKEENRDSSLQTGLLAQEVEKVMPELVKTDDKGMKSVNYMGIIPYMLEAVKMQQATNTNQQKQIETLKTLVEQLLSKK